MYQKTVLAVTGCLAALASAGPIQSRAVGAPPGGDTDILNYALTLEFLERKFYEQGIKNYTQQQFADAGYDARFYQNLLKIYDDEKTHVTFLQTALGNKAIQEPTFAFPSTDVKSFLGLSSVLEGVGVSAYLGAAAAIANPAYLTAAGSILTVEARHSSYIRSKLNQKPFPTAFDTPLDFNQVFSLAAQFVTGFAPGTNVPFKAFPPLTVAPSSLFCAGATTARFTNAAANAKSKLKTGDKVYAVFYSGLQTYYVPVTTSGNDYLAKLPARDYSQMSQASPAGQTYITLSTADGVETKASDDNTIAGVALIEISC